MYIPTTPAIPAIDGGAGRGNFVIVNNTPVAIPTINATTSNFIIFPPYLYINKRLNPYKTNYGDSLYSLSAPKL